MEIFELEVVGLLVLLGLAAKVIANDGDWFDLLSQPESGYQRWRRETGFYMIPILILVGLVGGGLWVLNETFKPEPRPTTVIAVRKASAKHHVTAKPNAIRKQKDSILQKHRTH